MTFALSDLNYWAVLVGGIFYMAFGALYFSPVLFGNTWLKLNQVNDGQTNTPLHYAGSVIAAFLASFGIAVIVRLTGSNSLLQGLAVGVLLGALVALVYFKNAIFGLMNRKTYAIAVGDHLIAFTVLSILHAMWK